MTNPIEKTDLLIVGSGPAGTSTALHLLQKDAGWAERMILIDKAVHPREKLCGGGITHLGENVLADLGLAIEPTNFPVREVRITYEEKAYSFHGNPVFRIVHRAEFDHWLVREARARGAEIREGETFLDLTEHDDYIEVRTDKQTYHAQALIAADGSKSRVRQKLGLNDGRAPVARLIEVLTPETKQTSWEFREGVAVFDFTRMTTHDLQGYYWDFPSVVDGKTQMNRGVFDSRSRPERPKADLKQTLADSMAERNRELNPRQIKGHPIRWFHWRHTIAKKRVLLAGDAAGADPLFGEGIAIALAYGRVAATAVHKAFAKQDFRFRWYKGRIFTDGVLVTVPLRTAVAQFAYLLKYPRLFRVGWSMAKFVMRFTPWRSPEFVPAKSPQRASQNSG